jgi:hypothetical protein
MQDAIDWGKNKTYISIERLEELLRKEQELEALKTPRVDAVEFVPTEPTTWRGLYR